MQILPQHSSFFLCAKARLREALVLFPSDNKGTAHPRPPPFLSSSRGAAFSILGYPWMLNQMPSLHTEEPRENAKTLHLMCHQVPFLTFLHADFIRKSVMSITFPPVILGPEMAAPILRTPGIFWFFLLENSHAHTIPRFRGGGGCWVFLEGGGGSADFIFMGVGIFPISGRNVLPDLCVYPETAPLQAVCCDLRSTE